MRPRHRIPAFLLLVSALALHGPAFADDSPTWTVPCVGEPPITRDGAHVVEGTAVSPPWSWHGRFTMNYTYGLGRATRAAALKGFLSAGFGFPYHLETVLAIPVGWTFGAKEPPAVGGAPRALAGMGADGAAFGDLKAALLYGVFDSNDGGFGLLFGLEAGFPTGSHARLMGEGGFSLEPLASFAFQVFGARLSLNLGYRLRPEHVSYVDGERFEQDDDLIWRAGVRVAREKDIAWAIAAEGTIGVATGDGFWPAADSRPVWIGASLEFPTSRFLRLALEAGGGVTGEAAPTATLGLTAIWLPALPDEDDDGVAGSADACPIMAEDKDGFEDGDGCPDLDNDKDGFPDDEDRCPNAPAADLSEDGC